LGRVGLAGFLGGKWSSRVESQPEKERLTNLIATGWLVRRFVPARQNRTGYEKKRKEKCTLKDNAEGSFTDLFSDTEVVTDDAGCGCGLGGMGGG
jgi:hypothetical protein